MMNSTHAPSGTLAGLAAARLAQLVVPVDPMLAAVWVASCTAGAMLPDSDHPASSTAKLWGPFTAWPCRGISRVAGGHRHGTHDVTRGAPGVFAVVVALGLLLPPLRVATVAVVIGLCFVGLAALIPGRGEKVWPVNLVVSWGAAYAVTPAQGWPLWTVVLAAAGIAAGVVVGIAGDACTPSGVPWWGKRVHLLPGPMRITTGSWVERWIVQRPVLVGVVVLGGMLAT